MSGHPLLSLTCHSEQCLKVTETEEVPLRRTLLADILPDRRFDVAASQRTRRFVVGSHRVSSLVK